MLAVPSWKYLLMLQQSGPARKWDRTYNPLAVLPSWMISLNKTHPPRAILTIFTSSKGNLRFGAQSLVTSMTGLNVLMLPILESRVGGYTNLSRNSFWVWVIIPGVLVSSFKPMEAKASNWMILVLGFDWTHIMFFICNFLWSFKFKGTGIVKTRPISLCGRNRNSRPTPCFDCNK